MSASPSKLGEDQENEAGTAVAPSLGGKLQCG